MSRAVAVAGLLRWEDEREKKIAVMGRLAPVPAASIENDRKDGNKEK